MSSFPPSTLGDPHAILDEYLPLMLDMIASPHIDHHEEWIALRERCDALFEWNGWLADESRVAFDLLVAFAEMTIAEARANS